MDYDPTRPHSHLHRNILDGLRPLQGSSIRDPFVLAQVQAVLEDCVWQFVSTAEVRLEYVDAASLVAVFAVDGMMLSTIRVQLATPDPRALIVYKDAEQETE